MCVCVCGMCGVFLAPRRPEHPGVCGMCFSSCGTCPLGGVQHVRVPVCEHLRPLASKRKTWACACAHARAARVLRVNLCDVARGFGGLGCVRTWTGATATRSPRARRTRASSSARSARSSLSRSSLAIPVLCLCVFGLLCLCVFGLLCLCVFGLLCLYVNCFRNQGVQGAGAGSKHGVVRRSRVPCDPRASGTLTSRRLFRVSFGGGMLEPADKYAKAPGRGGGVDLGLGAAGSSVHACAPAR